MSAWRRRLVLLTALVVASAARSATLDVAAVGDDLVFTWDAGSDDILRGTTPDNLQPWLTGVSSPLVVPDENAIRGEDAFYRLASGSNMAIRVEKTFDVPDGLRPWTVPTTLPLRRTAATPSDLFAQWPSLVEVVFVEGGLHRGASRVAGVLVGEFGRPIPPHGGVWLAFQGNTTVTLVGSDDDGDAGVETWETTGVPGNLPLPPHLRWTSAVEVLCGTRGVDWFDADADGFPDECGRDVDGDGDLDTGLANGSGNVAVLRDTAPGSRTCRVVRNPITREVSVAGTDFAIAPGDGLTLAANSPSMNEPFDPPTW